MPSVSESAKKRLATLKTGSPFQPVPKAKSKTSNDAQQIRNRQEAEEIPEAGVKRGFKKR